MFKNKIRNRLRYYAASFMLRHSIPKVSWWRTIFTNFYFLPFSQAKQFPIYVYGKMKFKSCNGSISINTQSLKRGMIKLNMISGGPGALGGETILNLNGGEIVFNGPANIECGVKIMLWGNGILKIGANCLIATGANIACCRYIEIGHDSRVVQNVQLMDNNFHFCYNTSDMKVRRFEAPIVIGHHCWLGNRTTIMKGVTLPPYTIVASNSLVNKSVAEKERCLIAGQPARLIKEGYSRVFNIKMEIQIARYFNEFPESKEYQLDGPLSDYD